MGRRAQQRQDPPTRLTVQLGPDLTARIVQQHRATGLPGTYQDTARDLLLAALDYPEVEASLTRSARMRGYLDVRRRFRVLSDLLLEQLAKAWQREEHVTTVDDEEEVPR
jgi:hypothetical protein